MLRRDFLATTSLSTLVIAGPDTAARADARPNIVYILADDLGYGDLGCYGQSGIQTPNIDRLAAEGVRFTQHYAGSTVCAPSRCALMTGLHTGHCYIRGNQRVNLRPEDVTVAEVLKGAGYATGLCGKWGLGAEGEVGVPNRQGFDYFYGYLDQGHAHNYYPTFLMRNEERVNLENVVPDAKESGAGVARDKKAYSHDLIAQEGLEFIRRSHRQPFFLYWALTLPHANNEAGEAGMEVPDQGIYSDREWPENKKNMAAMVSRLDRDVGRLLDLLAELGIEESTLVIFASDNGPHKEGGNDPTWFDSNGPLRGIKRDLYEGGIRVPLIGRWPGRIRPGTTCGHVSAFWDFLPTAAELAGASLPDHLDGISYVNALIGNESLQDKHDYLYWEFTEQGGKQAVRQGDWKGIRLNVGDNPDGPLALYNLADDLGESVDLAGAHPDIVQDLAERMKEAHVDSPLFPLQAVARG